MRKAVFYGRYSSNNQTEQSIDGQRRACEEYARQKGFVIAGEYIDRAISGRTDNRPDFQRLMEDCTKKLFEAVIVYRTDRFARDKYDSAIYKRHLKRNNITLHYAAEPIPEGPEGIILEGLLESMAEYYSAELSQKIRRGMRESALKSKYTGGRRLFGYRVMPDMSFALDEREAPAVKTIFDMYIKGETTGAIADYLNGIGLKTSGGNAFAPAAITHIITNEKYVGVYKCKDIRTEEAVPDIIDKEVFYMAQREVARRKISKKTTANRADYLLADKIFCGHCKRGMVGASGTSKSGGVYYYYQCPNARGRAKTCNKKHVAKDWIEELVVSETISHVLNPGAVKYISHKLCDIMLADKSRDEEANYFKTRLVDNKKSQDNLLKAIESGVETTALPKRLRELELERTQLTEELRRAEARRFTLSAEQIEFMLLQYREGDAKEIIDYLVAAVYVYDDKLVINYNIDKSQPELARSEKVFVQKEDNCRLL